MTKHMVSRGLFALTVLFAAGGARAESAPTVFTATSGRNAYTFQIDQKKPRVERGLSWGDSLTGFSAVGADVINDVVVHGSYENGSGEFFALRGEPGQYWLDPIAKTPYSYHTFTLVGERMYAARDAGGNEDVIVELEPGTLRETNEFGRFELAIDGMVYVPELDEFVVSDRLSSAFYALEYGEGDEAGPLRTIGPAGFALGSNGLDYRDGHIYGAAVRRDDGSLVFGEISLQTGAFDVIIELDDESDGQVGLGSTISSTANEKKTHEPLSEFGTGFERAWNAAGLGVSPVGNFGSHAGFAGSGGGGGGSPITDSLLDPPDDELTDEDLTDTDTSTTDDGGSGGGGGDTEVPTPGTLSVLGFSGLFMRRRR